MLRKILKAAITRNNTDIADVKVHRATE